MAQVEIIFSMAYFFMPTDIEYSENSKKFHCGLKKLNQTLDQTSENNKIN
jgi:hypothetical protein